MTQVKDWAVRINCRSERAIGLAKPKQFIVAATSSANAVEAAMTLARVQGLEIFHVISVVEMESAQ